MKVYIGYDAAEHLAVQVAQRTLLAARKRPWGVDHESILLVQEDLRARGLYTRPEVIQNGQRYDVLSQAPCSTAFSLTRFLVPILRLSGLALFLDCDMAFREDPSLLLREAQERQPDKAVWVVKHQHAGAEGKKMCGLAQTQYPRKNWSSVVLWDCDHPANRRLTLRDVNTRPGSWLHQFGWLADDEIGELDPKWNQLIGVQPDSEIQPDKGILHWTLGGPWFEGWEPKPFDDLWVKLAKQTGVLK